MDGTLTTWGGLKVGADGDIELLSGKEETLQRAVVRLRSHSLDYLLHPEICCDLENFLGEPMNPTTLTRLEQQVQTILRQDTLFPPGLPIVTAIPAQEQVVVLVIESGGPDKVVVPFSYREGFIMPGNLTDTGRLVDYYTLGSDR